MDNEYYGVASTPMDDYLAHYGVRGMKWGVRKAIKSGNSARLGKQYDKAQKKLAKLEKRAAKADTYKKRAIRMGVGAAAVGGLAAAGTGGISTFMKNNAKYAGAASKGVGNAMVRGGQLMSKIPGANKAAGKVIGAGYTLQANKIKNANSVYNAGRAVDAWGKSNSLASGAGQKISGAIMNRGIKSGHIASATTKAGNVNKALGGISNNTLARIGAGAIGAGLAAGAAKNAYRAATAQKKAAQFRSEMNKAFAGTKYANGGAPKTSSSKKRRR